MDPRYLALSLDNLLLVLILVFDLVSFRFSFSFLFLIPASGFMSYNSASLPVPFSFWDIDTQEHFEAVPQNRIPQYSIESTEKSDAALFEGGVFVFLVRFHYFCTTIKKTKKNKGERR